jgi:hypothetical protein
MMKPVYLIILPLLFFITSCEKSDLKPADLDGEWKLVSTRGGYAVNLPGTQPPADVRVVISNSDYQIFNNGQLSQSSKFTLVKVNERIDDHKYSYKLDFENSMMLDQYIDIEIVTLQMQSGSIAADHVVSFYRRQ